MDRFLAQLLFCEARISDTPKGSPCLRKHEILNVIAVNWGYHLQYPEYLPGTEGGGAPARWKQKPAVAFFASAPTQ
jgi:hypothetical protein